MSAVTDSGGHRRIDRVLAADFLDGLGQASLEEVRRRRDEAAQEESDVSYLRRLVQGRIDVVRAELERRAGSGSGSLIDDLPRILADANRGEPRGAGRHLNVEPSRADAHRRHVEALVADVDLSDVSTRDDAALRRALEIFQREEERASATRRSLQEVVDACAAELTRRYRDGEADVAGLLAAEGEQA
jgi:hypothetical protein